MRPFKSVAAITLVLSFCPFFLSAGGASEASTSSIPPWIASQPADANGRTFFVATGTDGRGNEAVAQDAATLDLIGQINRYLGVSITSESNAAETVTANEYSALIVGLVKQSAGGDVAGMRIADRFVRKTEQGISVYLLGEYRTADLESEKAKRAALAREKEDAVSVPEAKGTTAEKSGRLFEAIRLYLEAASAAANAAIRNSETKFERNIQNAVRVVSMLQISKVGGPMRSQAKKPFEQDFVVQVTDASASQPVNSVDLVLGYKEYQPNGKFRIKSVVLKTDANGKVAFRLPDPASVGPEKLSFTLDISAFLKALENVADKQKDLVDSVARAAAQKRVTFDYQVVANALGNTIAALVLELDVSGNSLGEASVVQGIQQRLSAAGFKIASLKVGSNFLLGKSDQEVHLLLKDVVAGKADRIATGTARIQEIEDRASEGVFVKVNAQISVIDMSTGDVLLAVSKLANERGSNKHQAISAAFAKLGLDIGDQLARDLP